MMLPLASTSTWVLTATVSPAAVKFTLLVAGSGLAALYALRKPGPAVSVAVIVTIAAVAPGGTAIDSTLAMSFPLPRLMVRV